MEVAAVMMRRNHNLKDLDNSNEGHKFYFSLQIAFHLLSLYLFIVFVLVTYFPVKLPENAWLGSNSWTDVLLLCFSCKRCRT